MADEFDLSALKNAMGVSNKPTTSNVSTVISPEIQRKRDEDALSIQQAELKKAQSALTQTTDPKQKLRLEADIAGLTREIARNSASKSAPATAPIAPSVPEQQQDFDLSGVKSAMGLQAPTTGTPPDQQQITSQTTSVEAPAQPAMPKQMFEPKTELEKQVMLGIQSLPGSKELGAFGQAVTGTVSKSVSAIQQLVGKYFPGLSDDQRQTIVDNSIQSTKQVESALKPVEEHFPKSALAGEVTGFVFNPINKLVPTFGAAPTTLLGAGLKAGGQGAVANVLTTPITDQEKPFETQKIMQAVTGAIGGAGAGVAFLALGHQLGKGVDAIRTKFNNAVPDNQINQAASQIVSQAGIDSSKVSPQFFNSLVDQAKSALRTGDVKGFQQFAKNYAEANSLAVPVPMLRGQLTRDPMQYAVEQNLRGIQGVGEPIQAVLQKQNNALLQNLDEYGAKLAQPVVNSGSFLRNVLKQIDAGEAQKVRDAYTAFKNSTGKDLDIPLSGLAQDYAKVVKDFGRSTIPEGVRNNLESLGLIKGKQLKVTTIEDAEAIIKNINANYDKTKPVQMKALDELRRAVEDSIKGAGANLPGEAGALAKAARDAASKRFDTIADIPALKDTMKGIEPDKFIQKHILQGNVNEIDKLVKYLQNHSPETLTQLRADVMGVIKNRVTNNVSDANAKFSADGLKGFVAKDSASLSRLEKFLSTEQINGLQQLNRVAENVLVEPVASAVNRSNTASAAANLIQGTVKSGAVNELLSNIASIKFPGVATGARYLAEMNQGSRAQELINQAITPTAKAPSVPIRTMVKPGVAGAGALTGEVRQSNIQYEKENR